MNNTPIQIGITYLPRGLLSVSPAQAVYSVRYNSINYTSGLLNFDEGNTSEDPPHGLWGALNPWYAGGHDKMFLFPSGLMLGGKFTIMDYLIWNEIPTVVGNLVGGLAFTGLTLYDTHVKTAPKRAVG